MTIGIAAGAVVALVWLGLRLTRAPDAPPSAPKAIVHRATVTDVRGHVEVALQDTNTTRPAAPPDVLKDGDVVTTYAQSGADVVFDGNNVVHMGPDTSLVVGPQGGGAATLGAVLLAGSAKVETGQRNVDFQIGTSVGVVQMPKDALAMVEIRFDEGVKVLTGEVNLVAPQAQVGHVLLSGQEITLEDVRVQANSGAVDGLTVQVPAPPAAPPPTLAVRVRPRGGRVRLRPRSASAFRRVRAAQALGEGDILAIASRGSASVTLDDVMHVEMGPKARFILAKTVGGDAPHTAQVKLSGGPAEIAIDSAAVNASAEVTVSKSQLTVVPTDKAASVDVKPKGKRAAVYVRFGEAKVGSKDILHAGQTAWVQNNAIVNGPKPAYPEALQVQTDTPAEIYYDAEAPPVRFVFPVRKKKTANDGPRHVQWAKTAQFVSLDAAEVTQADSFAHDRVQDGPTFWRTLDAPTAVGELTLSRDAEADCADCQALHVVRDTGENVALRYENVSPKVRLQWDAHEPGATYILRIYNDGDLRTPVVSQNMATNSFELPNALLKDGSYHWYVQRQLAADTPQSAKTVNTLLIEHEARTDGLALSAPALSLRTKRGRITSSGRVAPGAKMTLNGTRIKVRADGTFKFPVRLRAGKNRLVYRVTEHGNPERYYIRDVLFR